MSQPNGFSWIERPLLAGLARPDVAEDLAWLRQQGMDFLVSLTEDPVRRDWVNDAGLMMLHVPVQDMEAPTPEQLERAVTAINRANDRKMGVAVHCTAGLGRTGVVLAAVLVSRGMSAQNALARVRRLRPGSIETHEQADAVVEYARKHGVV